MQTCNPAPKLGAADPVGLRLVAAARCSPELLRLTASLGERAEALSARTVLQTEREPMRRPRHLVDGWAARLRHLTDGRRQIFDLVLPGEGLGLHIDSRPLAHTDVIALTPVRLADAGPLLQAATLDRFKELRPALQAQADEEARRMLDQIVRLGRLSAPERMAHLLLDLRDRLDVIGQVEGDRFPLPLTQETLADICGLSVVHVNRTLQELRRQDLVRLERGVVRLPDLAALARLADYAGLPGHRA